MEANTSHRMIPSVSTLPVALRRFLSWFGLLSLVLSATGAEAAKKACDVPAGDAVTTLR